MFKKFLAAVIVGIGIVAGFAFATVTGTYTPSRVSTDGNTTEYSFDFQIPAQGDLVVQLLNSTTLNVTNQTLGSNYTVTISKSTPGGHIDFTTAPAIGQYVQMYRDIDITQPANIPAGGLFREVQIENALDRNVLLLQQQQEQIDRCLKVAIGETVPSDYLGDAEAAAALAQGYSNTSQSYASNASVYATEAFNSATNATNAAASLNMPVLEAGDANKFLQVNSTGTGYIATGTDYILKEVYPIGCIYTTTVSTNPATVLGFGTWEAFGQGRVLVGKADAGTFSTANATGGVENVTLTAAQSGLPAHNIPLPYGGSDSGEGLGGYIEPPYNTATLGGTSAQYISVSAVNATEAHTNLQPYIVVYFWKRTA